MVKLLHAHLVTASPNDSEGASVAFMALTAELWRASDHVSRLHVPSSAAHMKEMNLTSVACSNPQVLLLFGAYARKPALAPAPMMSDSSPSVGEPHEGA